MKLLTISKPDKTLTGRVSLPASKSISNRLLMIEALSGSPMPLRNLSEADDTVLLKRLLNEISRKRAGTKIPELDCGNAGTVLRFLTALLAMKDGKWMLTGSYRMKQRPVGVLVEALISLGASIDYLGKPGFPPLLIKGTGLHGGEVVIDPGVSSQFTSALLMIGPLLPGGLSIRFKGNMVSAPYVKMTISLMEQAGIKVASNNSMIGINPGTYQPAPFHVPSDWSSAAFWYEAAALADDVDLLLLGLEPGAMQGDALLADIFRNFGVQSETTAEGIRLTKTPHKPDGFFFDFTNHPDIAQAVITTCVGLSIKGRFEGVKSLQIKETDRLRAIKNEIEKLGFDSNISTRGDEVTTLEIWPVKPVRPLNPCFDTYGDHRMAMALAPLAIRFGSVKIRNPEVVVKSYPDFWRQMEMVGFVSD